MADPPTRVIPTLMRAAGHPIPSKRATHQHSSCTPVQHLGNRPQSQSCHRRRRPPRSAEGDQPPISTLRMGRTATPFRGGRRGNRCKRDTHRRHTAFLCSIPERARSPGRFCEARQPLLWSCGTTARRLPGTPAGDTPFASVFRGARRKKSAVDGETWYFTHCHLVGFRVSSNPILINLATHLV